MFTPFLPFPLFWLILGYGLFKSRIRRNEVGGYISVWFGLLLLSFLLHSATWIFWLPILILDVYLAEKVLGNPSKAR